MNGEGFDWVHRIHGASLPEATNIEEFYCNSGKVCIKATIRILPCSKDKADPCEAAIIVDIINCETGEPIDTIFRDIVSCPNEDDVSAGSTMSRDASWSCGGDYFDIYFDYGCICECPISDNPEDKGAGSVRIRVRSIIRRVRR
ncbi:MAG: hypothetical protein HYR95_01855 [Candidatus Colwellbacteria bacterium]|nr:hypothetical protein [Candidatus Colwellbacteria bacterium]MBI3273887.1 hypothetical protein [Candidatus Colwellbacteria bacterium]